MSKTELQKHTLNLRKGDLDRLGEFYPELAPTQVIRRLISAHVDKLERKVLEEVDVEISL